MDLLRSNPYVFEYMDIDSVDDIESLSITAATELEFWVKTPDDDADREQLSTAQMLKEQYWKRTTGPVRTALEEAMLVLQKYGFEMEMGHKEVGGVKAKLGNSGNYDHVMEQLEIDWKYSSAVQAADNENHIKYVVRDIFRTYGLEVTFMAKPMEGVAGNGEHTHMGVAAKLKDGRMVNLFTPADADNEFMSPVGFGALMGLLKNYDVVNPFVSSSNRFPQQTETGIRSTCMYGNVPGTQRKDAIKKQDGTGRSRDRGNPMATRFELRAPESQEQHIPGDGSVIHGYAGRYQGSSGTRKDTGGTGKVHIQGIRRRRFLSGTEQSVQGSQKDVFEEYTQEERDRFFGKAPNTVWENICAFDKYPEKLDIFRRDDVMTDIALASYREAVVEQWTMELRNRIIPDTMDLLRSCSKAHDDLDCVDYDRHYWEKIQRLRKYIGKDTLDEKCLLTKIVRALDEKDYDRASELQIEMQAKVEELEGSVHNI